MKSLKRLLGAQVPPINFLCGMPRTGSTVLAAILNQNPEIFATNTSPLYPFLVQTNEIFNTYNLQYTFNYLEISEKLYLSIVDSFYGEETRIIFDKHRGWGNHIDSIIRYINPSPKLIFTVRPIQEIITSYFALIEQDPDNFIDKHLIRDGIEINWESRAYLLWTKYMQEAFESTAAALENHREKCLVINYCDLVNRPLDVINSIYSFYEISAFKHNFNNIEAREPELKDEGWGLKNLHTIKSKLGQSSKDPSIYLPPEAISYFNQFNEKIGVNV